MPNNIFIIGNSFDLDLGLKTKYSDFAKSEYWPKCVGFKDFLCQFLNQKKDKENWFDIEQELFNFASKEKNISPKNPESDMLFFEKLKQQLCDYITQQHNSELKIDSVAASVLNAVISNNFFDSIYSFNYTDLNLFAKKLGLSLNKSCRYIHGKVSDRTIILGVDERPLWKGYDLLHKTMSPHYRSHSIFDDLMNADEVVIFGLSFGCIDYTYFDRFFRAQSSEDRNRDDKKKNITIFTKDENSRVDILNKLKGMNVNIQNLYAQSNFQIIRTECEQDKVLLEDFCSRLDKFSYKKIGASVFVK